MASLADVVERIIVRRGGRCATMELHKLVVMAHGFRIRYDRLPLLNHAVTLGDYGPRVPALFDIAPGPVAETGVGDAERLTKDEQRVIDETVSQYGVFNGLELAETITELGLFDTIELHRLREQS